MKFISILLLLYINISLSQFLANIVWSKIWLLCPYFTFLKPVARLRHSTLSISCFIAYAAIRFTAVASILRVDLDLFTHSLPRLPYLFAHCFYICPSSVYLYLFLSSLPPSDLALPPNQKPCFFAPSAYYVRFYFLFCGFEHRLVNVLVYNSDLTAILARSRRHDRRLLSLVLPPYHSPWVLYRDMQALSTWFIQHAAMGARHFGI